MFKMNLSTPSIPRGPVTRNVNAPTNGNHSLVSRGVSRAPTAQIGMNIANLKTTRGCGCGK